MNLSELIASLEKHNPAIIVKRGFHNPHSWRGSYWDLAFEPTENVSIGDMLAAAKSALGTTYEGWKGGDFVMGGYTKVHISNEGDSEDLALGLLVESFSELATALATAGEAAAKENASEQPINSLEFKRRLDLVCQENWKAREMIERGGFVALSAVLQLDILNRMELRAVACPHSGAVQFFAAPVMPAGPAAHA